MNFKVNNTTVKMLSLNESYPVNSILITMKAENPSTYLGGSWSKIGEGQTIVGVNPNDNDFKTAGKTGGAKEYDLRATIGAFDGNIGALGYLASTKYSNRTFTYGLSFGSGTAHIGSNRINHSTLVRTADSSGTTKYYTTVQQYITTYFWKRVG